MAHERGDMLRAVMEGVGYNLGIILDTMRKNGSTIDSLIAVGGGARNPAFIDILGDILGVSMKVPSDLEEATSMGAAITGAVGIGAIRFDDAESFIKIARESQPNEENVKAYRALASRFDALYEALYDYFETV
jgi:xylulokinase